MMGLFQDLVAIQRQIYLAFAERIGDFARTGAWLSHAAKARVGQGYPLGGFAALQAAFEGSHTVRAPAT